MENTSSYRDDSLLYISFNQDHSCFVAGTQRGFKIFNSFPYKLKFERILDGGIGIIEMLYRSNVLALVGGGKSPKYTPNRVILWDDYQTKVLNEFKFTSTVKNIKLKKDKILIACDQRCYIYSWLNYKQLDMIETIENPKGIIAVNTDPEFTILAYPISPKGFIKIKYYEQSTEVSINAHESNVSYIAMNNDGSIVATASENGKLIRVFNCSTGNFIIEFRRGKEKAQINYLCFEQYSKYIAATSDRGTIHIWSLKTCWSKWKQSEINESKEENKGDQGEDTDKTQEHKEGSEIKGMPDEDKLPNNPTSALQVLPNFWGGAFFTSDKSFAQVRINDSKTILGFGPENNIIIISSIGKYYLAQMNIISGGNCSIIAEEYLHKK